MTFPADPADIGDERRGGLPNAVRDEMALLRT